MKKIEILADVRQRLESQGFGGLYNDGGRCSCRLDDLAPCGECQVEIVGAETSSPEAEEWINGCEAGFAHTDPSNKNKDVVISPQKEPLTADEFDSIISNC